MLQEFLSFIKSKNLFDPSQRILLAVSGGIDSITMADLFAKAKFDFAIAHCNFGLRGEESDADEVFVKKLAVKYKVPFFTTTFQTEAFAESEKLSTQMAARMLRYQWFESLLEKEKFDYLATAHHQNDVLETVLLNLSKGTGIAGLHGIRIKNNNIIRPLWFAEKELIFDYVVENQLIFREDSSNESVKYQRNLLRNEVVPLLKQINPNLDQSIRQTVERVMAAEDVFEKEIITLQNHIVRKENGATFIKFSEIIEKPSGDVWLHELLKPFHFNFVQSQEITLALEGEAGKTFLSPTHTLVKDRTELVITAKDLSDFGTIILEEGIEEIIFGTHTLEIEEFERPEDFDLPTGKNIACLDAEKLQFPLQIRKWKVGDWFCPLGMNGKKNISDLLNDLKIPNNLKEQVYVLTSGGSIVWIIGHRIDNRFKVTPKTEGICLITLKK